MYVLRWSVALIMSTAMILWLVAMTGLYQPHSWQYSLRMAGGIFFLLALVASGVMSVPRYRRRGQRKIVLEDLAFVFIVCTISLFGISMWFD